MPVTERIVAAYGKLPLSKEFLRHACYEGCGRELKAWLDTGHDRYTARTGGTGAAPDENMRRLLFLPPATVGEMAAGVSINSRDASGERRFPFVVFAAVEQSVTGAERSIAPLEALWETLERHLTKLRGIMDSALFYEQVRALRAESPASGAAGVADPLGAVPVEHWLAMLYEKDGADLWVRALWRLRSLMPSLKAQLRSPQLGAFRVPLARQLPMGSQIDLWRSILTQLPAGFPPLPTLILPGRDDRRFAAYIFLRPLEPDDFPALVGAPIAPERFTDLAESGGRLPAEGFGAFRERLTAGPLRPGATLAALRGARVF